MSTTTLDSLQAQVNAILARLALLDGQGLLAPAQGFTTTIQAQVNGLKSDIEESVLSLEANLNDLYTDVETINGQVDQVLGVTNTTYSPVIITPPTT
jgi:hypothetical protein